MTRYVYSLMVLVLSVFFLAGGYQLALSEEGMKDKALDAKITSSVKTHLATNDGLKTLTQISVKTVDKNVYLLATVPTQQEKDLSTQATNKMEQYAMTV